MIMNWLLRKFHRTFIILFLLLCFNPLLAFGFLNWIFGSNDAKKLKEIEDENLRSSRHRSLDSNAILAKIPFELEQNDEKFLAEAAKFSDIKLSDLDLCHHRVILGLKKSCALLSEEDIAKLSVNLLNCQSAVEGRPVFQCTNDMSIKECTKDMNQDTWNAYHIVSNRARAVCYSSRQIQFRSKTEMAVNKLVLTAEQQLMSMAVLKEGQEQLGKATANTLESISNGHKHLIDQQDVLRSAQNNIQVHVANNLRELTREKALIASGQKELAELTASIRLKLDEADKHFESYEEGRRKNHEEIINDLSVMHMKAKEIWEKIDNSTRKIILQHEETSKHYQETLMNLQRVNSSINYLMDLVEKTRHEIDEKLNWLTAIAGGTGSQLAAVVSVALHLGFFLVAAVGATFINAPMVTRMALLIIVPLNAMCDINGGQRLDFSAITAVVAFITIFHWIFNLVWRLISQKSIGANRVNSSLYITYNGAGPQDNHVISNGTSSVPMTISDESDGGNITPELRRSSESALSNIIASVRKTIDGAFSGIRKRRDLSCAASGGDTGRKKETTPPSSSDEDEEYAPDQPIRNRPVEINEEEIRRVRRDLLSALDRTPPPQLLRQGSRSSTPLRRSNSPLSKACLGFSARGIRCRSNSIRGGNYCHRHGDQESITSND